MFPRSMGIVNTRICRTGFPVVISTGSNSFDIFISYFLLTVGLSVYRLYTFPYTSVTYAIT